MNCDLHGGNSLRPEELQVPRLKPAKHNGVGCGRLRVTNDTVFSPKDACLAAAKHVERPNVRSMMYTLVDHWQSHE